MKRDHGLSRTREYQSWKGMMQRCYNANLPCWVNHGGKGITVCERWHDFTNFLTDMGTRPAGLTLERIDNSGNYEPSNCRWATYTDQNRNKSNLVWIEYNGILKTRKQWADDAGISQQLLIWRLSKGQPFPEALSTPREWTKIK